MTEARLLCPYCDTAIKFTKEPIVGQMIRCPHCERLFFYNEKGQPVPALGVQQQYQVKQHDEQKSEVRHGSPRFYKLLAEMADTHSKKSHDYASNENPYGNYHFAGHVSSMFSHSPEDAGFAGRLAEKIFRISNLESGGKNAKNESIEDTERDICVIAALWMADRRDRREKPTRWQRELKDFLMHMPDSQLQDIHLFIQELFESRTKFTGPLADLVLGRQTQASAKRREGEPEPPQQR